MKQEQFFVKSPCDGLNLSTLTVLPQLPEKAEGIVQLIHGMAEHKERYLHFMEFLAAHGYICIIHDHRGHGKSVKSSADLGYFYGQGSDGLVEDTAAVTRYARSRWPNLPVFLIGHSMGSLIARAYTKKYDDQIERLILIGSPSEKGGARIALALTKLMKILRGGHHVSLLIDRLAAPRAKDKTSGSRVSWICSLESVVRAYEMDALCGFTFTADGYEALIRLMIDVYDKDGWQMNHPSLPVHFASGAEDVCLIDETHFRRSADFMRQVGYSSVTAKLYRNLRHEILNENGREEVYTDLLTILRGEQR